MQLAGCGTLPLSHPAAQEQEWRYIPSDSEIAAVGAGAEDAFLPPALLVVEFCQAYGVPERAFAYFQSQKNHLLLSWMYLSGTGVAKDLQKARFHWEQCGPDERDGEERGASKQRLKELIDSTDGRPISLERLFDIHTTPELARFHSTSESFRAKRRKKERQHWAQELPESVRKALEISEKLFACYQEKDGVRVYMENQGGTIRTSAAIWAEAKADAGFQELIMTLAGYRPARRMSPQELQTLENQRIEAVRDKRRYYASNEFQEEIKCKAADNLRHMSETETSWEAYRDATLVLAGAVNPKGMLASEWERFVRFLLIRNRLRDLAGPFENDDDFRRRTGIVLWRGTDKFVDKLSEVSEKAQDGTQALNHLTCESMGGVGFRVAWTPPLL